MYHHDLLSFCSVHYKEYLVSLINQNHIDPVVEMDLVELQQTLHRTGIQVPDPFANEQDIMYLGRLRMVRIYSLIGTCEMQL